MEQKKRRHHIVPKSYLEHWAHDGRMFCLKEGRIFSNTPLNLAVVNDFYRLDDLNQAEVEFLHTFAKTLPDRGQGVIRNFISLFTLHSQLEQYLGSEVVNHPEIIKAIDIHKSNLEENFHAAIEGGSHAILNDIRNGNLSFYQDVDKCVRFMHFIALQILRTKKMADGMKRLAPNTLGINIEKVWPVQRHMVASNFGCNLFLERKVKPITLLRNNTDMHFVTSDQPVINLFPEEAESGNVLAVYYPVSPTVAVIFGDLKDSIPRPEWIVTTADVRYLNRLMKATSHEMVFGDSESILSGLV